MPIDDLDLVQELVLGAAGVAPDELPAYLDARGAKDPCLRAEVISLVAHLRTSVPIDEPALGGSILRDALAGPTEAPPWLEPTALHPGESLGGYNILREIGRGGMGAVYLAEQHEPRRQVALKIMHASIASATARLRFQNEAQMLGLFSHPGIAQIYDARTVTAEEGLRPYFVMEYVEGETLDRWARSKPRSKRERVELLIALCDAVEHAHQRSVVHRDLKPANILVDGACQPKVLDFGVARLLDDGSCLTTGGLTPGTLPYMAPEQIEGGRKATDTRVDVYALGTIAYELLAGRRAFEVEGVSRGELVRRILDVDPARLGTIDRTLKGDLETIVAKAIEKDPARRYSGVSALAVDLRRYLDDEPILARPPSRSYQLRKFAKRHRGLVAGFVVASLAMLLGTLLALNSARGAMREAERTKRTFEFLRSTLLAAEPNLKSGVDRRVSDLLEEASPQIDIVFAAEPDLKAEVQQTIGTAFARSGRLSEAEPLIASSFDWRSSRFGAEDNRTLGARHDLGVLRFRQGRLLEAIDLLRGAWQGRRHSLGEPDPETLRSATWLAIVLQEQGALDEAEDLQRSALALRRETLGDHHRDTLTSLSNLAKIDKARGRVSEAEGGFRRVLALQREVLGENDVDALTTENNLGSLFADQARFEEAKVLLEHAVAGLEHALGPAHDDVLVVRENLAMVRRAATGTRPETPPRIGPTRSEEGVSALSLGALQAYSLWSDGRYREAEVEYRRVAEGFAKKLGDRDPKTLGVRLNHAASLAELGQIDEALAECDAILATMETAGLLDDLQSGKVAMLRAGDLRRRKGDLANAEPYVLDAVAALDAKLGLDNVWAIGAHEKLARLRDDQGDVESAEREWKGVLRCADSKLATKSVDRLRLVEEYGEFLVRRGRYAEAEVCLGSAITGAAGVLRDDHPVVLATWAILAKTYAATSRPEAASRARACATADYAAR
jgi:serine/threonine protein kinase/Tfp pilus assembly protein PilF